MENDYHNPYDHRPLGLGSGSGKSNTTSDNDQANVYEAPSCLVRNPSGSLFIPSSGKLPKSCVLFLLLLRKIPIWLLPNCL